MKGSLWREEEKEKERMIVLLRIKLQYLSRGPELLLFLSLPILRIIILSVKLHPINSVVIAKTLTKCLPVASLPYANHNNQDNNNNKSTSQ